jgi:hypothetical protein
MKSNVFDWQEFEPNTTCHIAVAIVGAGALGAGASIYGANKAANAQENAANTATQAQMSMFNTAKGEVQPFIDAGSSEIPQLKSWLDPTNASSPLSTLLKLTTPGADMSSTLAQTPGYQFTLNQGEKATQDALAARGLGGPGGPLAKGASQYAEGLAGNTWQSVVNSLLGTFTAGANPMQNLVNTGAGAAGTLTGAATQTGGQIGSNIIGAGNAAAGASVAGANAIGGLGSSVSSAVLLNKLLGSGSTGGLYGNAADAGIGNGVGTGGFNFMDAAAP